LSTVVQPQVLVTMRLALHCKLLGAFGLRSLRSILIALVSGARKMNSTKIMLMALEI